MTGPWVSIKGLGLWAPGFPSMSAWAGGVADAAQPAPVGAAFGRANRRRAGALGRAIADAASEAMTEAQVDPAVVPIVVGSSVGEAVTMIGLLDQLWRTKEPMSPAAFTTSVHNAASGLLSISHGNRGFTTSLAADDDTPAAALLEAIGLVATRGGPVVVVCADEAVPESLVGDNPRWCLLAAAVVLAPLGDDARCARVAVESGPPADLAPASVGDALRHNPQVGLLDLVDAVLRERPGRVALDRGGGRGYVAHLGFDQ